jgi:hypothetical protein
MRFHLAWHGQIDKEGQRRKQSGTYQTKPDLAWENKDIQYDP